MKIAYALLITVTVLLVFSGAANASLSTIGTASYGGSDYNLIYEDDSIYGGLVWLDYTNSYEPWQNQVDWASGLNTGGVLTYDINPGVNVTWEGDWRLPATDESQCDVNGIYGKEGPDASGYHDYSWGYNMVNSEMGHLYYISLGNVEDGGLRYTHDFNNLWDLYWSGTLFSPDPSIRGWFFWMVDGYQGNGISLTFPFAAIAVRPANVSVIPIPSAIWLLSPAFIGLVGLRRRFMNA